MTEHDPLCRQRFVTFPTPCAECEVLATGRADERKKRDKDWTTWVRPAILADLRAQVEALRAENAGDAKSGNRLDRDFNLGKVFAYERVLALLKES